MVMDPSSDVIDLLGARVGMGRMLVIAARVPAPARGVLMPLSTI